MYQFRQALFPHIETSELQWLQETLPPPAYALFLKQARAEQRHALDVAQSIAQSHHNISPSLFNSLIQAALLHDCGKSQVRIRLWHRVASVLLQKLSPALCHKIEQGDSIFALPLRITSQHPKWGKLLARQAGLNEQVCTLIGEHHTPSTELGKLLQQADNRN